MGGADLVLCEGFKQSSLPKIEVWRRAIGGKPLYDPTAPNASEWIAIMTDDRDMGVEAACLVLSFSDTNWLHTLANLARERAMTLRPPSRWPRQRRRGGFSPKCGPSRRCGYRST